MLKFIHLAAAASSAVCSKLLCYACLFLLAESEFVLSTVAFGLSAMAALVGAWFLDATLGFPLVRSIAFVMGSRPCDVARQPKIR